MTVLVLAIDLLVLASWVWIEFGILVLITQSNVLHIWMEDSPSVWQLLLALHNVSIYAVLRYKFTPETFGEWLCNHKIWK